MRRLDSYKQLQLYQTQSRWLMLAVGLFIAVLRLCRAAPADEHSFYQAVCGTVPKCSQWQFT